MAGSWGAAACAGGGAPCWIGAWAAGDGNLRSVGLGSSMSLPSSGVTVVVLQDGQRKVAPDTLAGNLIRLPQPLQRTRILPSFLFGMVVSLSCEIEAEPVERGFDCAISYLPAVAWEAYFFG